MIARLILGNSAFFAMSLTFRYLPLGLGQTLISTRSISVAFMQYFLLGVHTTNFEVVAIIISIMGIAVMGISPTKDESIPDSIEVSDYLKGISAALYNACVMGIVIVMSRYLR